MWHRDIAIVRVLLLVVFLFLIGGFVAAQYGLVRDSVRILCISCLGLGG